MTNLIVGLLIGGIVGWFLCGNYTHSMIAAECERLGGFFVGSKTYKCVAVVEQQAESGVPDAILEASKGSTLSATQTDKHTWIKLSDHFVCQYCGKAKTEPFLCGDADE